MRNFIKNTTERSYLGRTQVRPQSGRVVAIDTVAKTMTLDTGHVDTNGVSQYLHSVPYLPGAAPAVGDNASLTFTDLTPYTPNVSGTSVGAVNSTSAVSGVSSIKANSGAAITGAVVLADTNSVKFTESGQNISASIPFWKQGF